MAYISLAVQKRDDKGKRAARKIRAEHKLPAIFYGPGISPVMLTVDYSELEEIVTKGSSEQTILDLHLDTGNGVENKKAMLKELQTDPLSGAYLHADFYEISMDRDITLNIPIQLVNVPVGVSKGGVLQQIRREIEITCKPDRLIESIEIDVSGLDIGDSLHIRDIDLPEGVTTSEDAHLTVAVVAAPAAEKSVEAEGEEMEEAEVEESETDDSENQ
ncbi:MAG: 50S ribosomal protein L25 [Deltaproteobacteria bacterium]|nr:50S ribosomal protein L25 [Deltaproteobacteria bacterium]